MHRWIIMSTTLLAVMACAACSRGRTAQADRGQDAVRRISVESVREDHIRRVIEVVGTLAAQDEATVSSEAAGSVVRVLADLGDPVRAGQVVVELDREKPQYRAEAAKAALNRSRAKYGASPDEPTLPPVEQTPDVKKAAAELSQAQQEWKRADELSKRLLLSTQEAEAAEAKYVTARAAYESALQNAKDLAADIEASDAALRLAERELADVSIKAPFNGYVQKRLVSPGQYVQVQTPVMSLVKVDPLKLITEVPEGMAPWVKAGGKVSLHVEAYPDREIPGTVSRISPAVNQQTRSFPIEAQVPNPGGLLKPGTFARVRIDSDRTDRILTVPAGALQNRYGVNRVFEVKDGRVTSHEVKLGDRVGDRVEIVDGVAAGEMIAASDVDLLAEGAKVQARGTEGDGAAKDRQALGR
jgi:membrane fusion protein, multidrug efflux system